MHPIFSVTLYTGQQLMLAGLQRWLYRPCTELDQQRRQRAGLRSLLMLLLKTAATGVVATVLDAAIEYRRRQLLAVPDSDDVEEVSTSRFGLASLSRGGIASWKARLLLAIDEVERQAHQYGLSGRPYCEDKDSSDDGGSESESEDEEQEDGGLARRAVRKGKAAGGSGGGAMRRRASADGLTEEERRILLGRTVEQLQALMHARVGGDPMEEEVDALVDSILGGGRGLGCASAPSTPAAPSLDVLAAPPRRTRSFAVVAPRSRLSERCAPGDEARDDACAICMDRDVQVAIAGCAHSLCFQCARRVCSTRDHALPQCPFCRAAIEGFQPRALRA